MDRFSNTNGDTYNGQFNAFVNPTPTVRIEFEQESYNDVNNISQQGYTYSSDGQYSQNMYNSGYSQDFRDVSQPAPTSEYYNTEMTPLTTSTPQGPDYPQQMVSPSQVAADPNSTENACDICGKMFSSNASMRRHREIHSGLKKFSCELCGNSYTQKHNLTKHMRLHTGEKPYACNRCDKSFYIHHHLKNHIAMHDTGEIPLPTYPCTICKKIYKHKHKLTRHMKTHLLEPQQDGSVAQSPPSVITSEDNSMSEVWGNGMEEDADDETADVNRFLDSFQDDEETTHDEHECEVCQQLFINKESLENHLKLQHSDDREFKCDKCTNIFLTRAHLVRHRQTHTGEQIFECAECNVSFRWKVSLHIHMRRHNNEYRKFECGLCNKYFLAKDSLLKHKNMVHYGVNTYECDECGEKFELKSDYKAHLNSHGELSDTSSKIAPTCGTCGKTFSSNSSLRKHEYTHMDIKPHKCLLCNVSFAQKIQLRLHNKRHNGGKMEPLSPPPKKKSESSDEGRRSSKHSPSPAKNSSSRSSPLKQDSAERRISARKTAKRSLEDKEEDSDDETTEELDNSESNSNKEIAKVRIKLNTENIEQTTPPNENGRERRTAARKARKIFKEIKEDIDNEVNENYDLDEDIIDRSVPSDHDGENVDDGSETEGEGDEKPEIDHKPLRMKIKTGQVSDRASVRSSTTTRRSRRVAQDVDEDSNNDEEDQEEDSLEPVASEPHRKRSKNDSYRYPVCPNCQQVFKKSKALRRHLRVCKQKVVSDS